MSAQLAVQLENLHGLRQLVHHVKEGHLDPEQLNRVLNFLIEFDKTFELHLDPEVTPIPGA